MKAPACIESKCRLIFGFLTTAIVFVQIRQVGSERSFNTKAKSCIHSSLNERKTGEVSATNFAFLGLEDIADINVMLTENTKLRNNCDPPDQNRRLVP